MTPCGNKQRKRERKTCRAKNWLSPSVLPSKPWTIRSQLLAAKFRSLSIWQDISPDSLAPQLRRLELEAQQVERSNPALSAVYMTALYKVAIQQVPYAPNQDERKAYGEKSEEYARKAMANPSLLASTKSIGYEPLVKQGIDGEIFQHDLLHVIGFETQAYREMHNFYTDQGNA